MVGLRGGRRGILLRRSVLAALARRGGRTRRRRIEIVGRGVRSIRRGAPSALAPSLVGASEVPLDRARRQFLPGDEAPYVAILLERLAEARVEPGGVAIEAARVVVASLVLRREPSAVGEERSERARRPLLDRIALGD